MKKELRKNFGVVVKLLDRMQRSVLSKNGSYFSSNQINFVRNIDIACGKLGEAVDAIFEDCKDVMQSKEDIVMTMMEITMICIVRSGMIEKVNRVGCVLSLIVGRKKNVRFTISL